jgi:uncharacterized protein YjbI with pentapeptide repeats
MANQEHLDLLIEECVCTWNTWRKQHPEIRPDLSKADLHDLDLNNVRLRHADLHGARLNKTLLSSAHLDYADLRTADLSNATLSHADLDHVDFTRADLSNANLRHANLSGAIFRGTNLTNTNFSHALLRDTLFAQVDLSTANGLDALHHLGPSSIGLDTISLSKGNIPESFLRDAGNGEALLACIRSLGEASFDYVKCFISYASQDQAFAQQLHDDLQRKGVQCWFAPESLSTGDKFKMEIDESIRHCDKLLVILSTHSVNSDWVQHEVGIARHKESNGKRLVIMPILLEVAATRSKKGWVTYIQKNRHIGEFVHWKDSSQYRKALSQLLTHLKVKV